MATAPHKGQLLIESSMAPHEGQLLIESQWPLIRGRSQKKVTGPSWGAAPNISNTRLRRLLIGQCKSGNRYRSSNLNPVTSGLWNFFQIFQSKSIFSKSNVKIQSRIHWIWQNYLNPNLQHTSGLHQVKRSLMSWVIVKSSDLNFFC